MVTLKANATSLPTNVPATFVVEVYDDRVEISITELDGQPTRYTMERKHARALFAGALVPLIDDTFHHAHLNS